MAVKRKSVDKNDGRMGFGAMGLDFEKNAVNPGLHLRILSVKPGLRHEQLA